MAKQEDFDHIHRLRQLKNLSRVMDIRKYFLDHSKLCPTCQKPIREQIGEPEMYFGELCCHPCVKAFRNGEEKR